AAGTSDPLGVKVASVANDPAPFPRVFNPAHPDANAQGFLAMPNVNPVQEMADLTVASRAYEANAAAFGVAKSMFVKALEIGR
ncbi:MAG TPA: flagellar basal body rod C-terminal domain-containing protein, partial [Elusimicrobiota bacterium]|nr:flagellar basal body rod C-terminal domain-containing protein [Elusimicrobiota bacterium]